VVLAALLVEHPAVHPVVLLAAHPAARVALVVLAAALAAPAQALAVA
jgi:hypothetical protein